MPEKSQQGTAKKFGEYLFRKGYSKNVIPIYCKKVKDFLNAQKHSCITDHNAASLKETISSYLDSVPFDQQKRSKDAALHTFYYSVTGKYFRKRLKREKRIESIEE